MNVERLQQAIKIIEGLEDKQVDLRGWQVSAENGTTVKSMSEVDCGTIACAGGWIALNLEMQEQGLSVGLMGTPKYKGYLNFTALALFFELPMQTAEWLFNRVMDDESTRAVSLESWGARISDRRIWLNRAREILNLHYRSIA